MNQDPRPADAEALGLEPASRGEERDVAGARRPDAKSGDSSPARDAPGASGSPEDENGAGASGADAARGDGSSGGASPGASETPGSRAAGDAKTDGADDGPDSEAPGESGPGSPADPDPDEASRPVDPDTTESLRAALEAARNEAQEERDAVLRARADTENVRRRAERDVEQAHRFGIEGLVRELLPVRDGLELGIRAARDGSSSFEALLEGTEMTLRMLSTALGKVGAVEVDPQGEDFDPGFHQAMSMREVEEGGEPGKVVQVVQKGCVLHGRVVRPAMVIVSK